METKKKSIEIAQKFIRNQKAIKQYISGEITKKQLNEKGVKIAMPI